MTGVELSKLTKWLNDYLDIANIRDDSVNGLQVQGAGEVKKAVLLVDFSLEGIHRATQAKADMIIVHHGLIWNGIKRVTGNTYSRLGELIKSGISLYAAHLPLDLHPECGNNAQLSRLLELTDTGTFANYYGKDIGVCGNMSTPQSVDQIAKMLEEKLDTKTMCLNFGPKQVKNIGIVSGAGVDALDEAVEMGLDCLLTGEPRQSSYHAAQESGINVIFAGHYATETVGVKALGAKITANFGVETQFIDIPTGI